jgi:hypothetical protein
MSLQVVCFTGFALLIPAFVVRALSPEQSPAPSSGAPRPVGTVKAISGNTITLSTDAGNEVAVQIQNATKLLRVAPGQKDLKDASPIQLQDVQLGDRILVRGSLAPDGKSVIATSVIAMKKSDIADKQAREREEWQRHGVGGLVSAVDPAAENITITTPALGDKKNVTIRFSKETIVRRYAPNSVKFDDAKPAPIDQIKPGDQLRARGARSPDGSELSADEIVSGAFRNIAGTISALDASAGTITVQDLSTKKPVTVRITSESQLRKLPLPMAQRIAVRLKGLPADGALRTTPTPPESAKPGIQAVSEPNDNGLGGGPAGMGRQSGGPPDLQQAISRMPPAALSDLLKGDAVMIVATPESESGDVTAIMLLGGVEPILEASPSGGASTILSPWSLGAPGGEAASP